MSENERRCGTCRHWKGGCVCTPQTNWRGRTENSVACKWWETRVTYCVVKMFPTAEEAEQQRREDEERLRNYGKVWAYRRQQVIEDAIIDAMRKGGSGDMGDNRERYEWMGNSHRYEIGGRSTDVRQIALSLYGIVRDAYPINGAPASIVRMLGYAEKACTEAERAIEAVVEAVSDDLEKEKEEGKCD
jgi:hypothetical protein